MSLFQYLVLANSLSQLGEGSVSRAVDVGSGLQAERISRLLKAQPLVHQQAYNLPLPFRQDSAKNPLQGVSDFLRAGLVEAVHGVQVLATPGSVGVIGRVGMSDGSLAVRR